jgi:uncharacterized membrane protein
MTNLQILKDAFSFAWTSTTKYFFKWLGYMALATLPLMVVGALLMRKLILMGWFGPNILPAPEVPVVFSSTEYGLYFVGMVIALYLALSFVTVLVQNMFDLYDGKEFRGLSNPLASCSVVSTLVIQTVVTMALTYAGLSHLTFMIVGERVTPSALNIFIVENGLGSVALLALIPGLYLGLRLILSYYIAVDTECKAIDAIKKSWEVTGRNFSLFAMLYLICALLNFIPFGFILFTPVCVLAYIYAYRTLSK